MKKEIENRKENAHNCRFLLIMSYLSSLLLTLVNIYVGYSVIKYFMGDNFSFLGGLFIAFSFVITIPLLVFSIKNIRRIREEKNNIKKFPAILGILGILTALVLHNATALWIYLLLFSAVLLLSSIVCRKKIKIENANIFIGILALSLLDHPAFLYAQDHNEMQEIHLLDKNDLNPYAEFISSDIKDMFHLSKTNKYPSINLFDGNLNTCWVAGSSGTNAYNTLYVRLPEKIDPNKIIFNIFSGYGKSKARYYQNARAKKLKISIYAAYAPEGHVSETAVKYCIKKYSEKIIKLSDTFAVQSFLLHLDKGKMIDFYKHNKQNCKSLIKNNKHKTIDTSFVLKLEILDTYKGSKYNDVCISEIFFNNRFVTAYPLKYNEVKNVYIKDDNVLMADYARGKKVVVYKNRSAVFTMVDWEGNENFALLHYTLNDEVGPGSRAEEHYALIDLKNRSIVNSEFKKCTGYSPMFGILEKKDGHTFIENLGEYNIELK